MHALRSCVFRLVGTTFAEGYPNTVYRCIELLADGEVDARLHRVPSNEHDPNAIAVICVAAGGRIGWVPRNLAARIAPAIDSGIHYTATLLEHVEHPDHPNNPGINVRIAIDDPRPVRVIEPAIPELADTFAAVAAQHAAAHDPRIETITAIGAEDADEWLAANPTA